MTHVTQRSGESTTGDYGAFYEQFDSPTMRRVRAEAYGEDIGQHSWVTADDLRADVARLKLDASSALLDLGCGPCGPLTFVLAAERCRGTGVELSASALAIGRARADSLGVQNLLSVRQADLNERLPFDTASFDAVMSLDVVLHLRDRLRLFDEVARVVRRGGRFLFTDACVLRGTISSEEVRRRSMYGYTQFSAPGVNERLLDAAGLRLIETEDRTASLLRNARGRLTAIATHGEELEHLLGRAAVAAQVENLETVVELAERQALSRVMYLAQAR